MKFGGGQRNREFEKADSESARDKNPRFRNGLLAAFSFAAAFQGEMKNVAAAQEYIPPRAETAHDVAQAAAQESHREAQDSMETYLESRGFTEALAEYRRKLEIMRTATTRRDEAHAFFVVRGNGTFQWTDAAVEADERVNSDAVSVIANRIDVKVVDDFNAELQRDPEARGQQLHTHPSRTARRHAHSQSERYDAKSVPPSHMDFISALSEAIHVGPDVSGRISYKAVTERGDWQYGFASPEAARRLHDAFSAGDEVLDRMDSAQVDREMRTMADALEEQYSDLNDPNHEILGVLIPRVLRMDGFLNAVKQNPALLDGIPHFVSLSSDTPSPDLAEIFQRFGEARDKVQEALRLIDPNTDGALSEPPFIGQFEHYLERWRGFDGVAVFLPPDETR